MSTINVPTTGRPQPVIAAAVVTVIVDGLGVATAFGVPITDGQRTALLAAVASVTALVGLLLAWRASRRVTPVESPAVVDGDTGRLVRLVPATAGGQTTARNVVRG